MLSFVSLGSRLGRRIQLIAKTSALWNLMRFIEGGAAKHEGRVKLPQGKLTWEANRHQVFELSKPGSALVALKKADLRL